MGSGKDSGNRNSVTATQAGEGIGRVVIDRKRDGDEERKEGRGRRIK